jgi:hypothetical protein
VVSSSSAHLLQHITSFLGTANNSVPITVCGIRAGPTVTLTQWAVDDQHAQFWPTWWADKQAQNITDINPGYGVRVEHKGGCGGACIGIAPARVCAACGCAHTWGGGARCPYCCECVVRWSVYSENLRFSTSSSQEFFASRMPAYQALAALQSVTGTAAVDAGGCATVVVTLFSHAVVLLELSLG